MKIKYSISHSEKMISHTTEQMIPRMVITKMHIFQNINHIASSTTISGGFGLKQMNSGIINKES